MVMRDLTIRDYVERRKGAMRKERQSFITHWKELSKFISVRRGRFTTTDVNRGGNRYNNIINSAATQAHRIARSGMRAGTMSSARPWFTLETFDPSLMESGRVRVWLFNVTNVIREILNSSNFYDMATTTLGELLTFATGCQHHVDDFDDVSRFYAHTIGSYMIAQNEKLKVDTFCREFEYTTEQAVGKFGYNNVSQSTRSNYDTGNYDARVKLTHFVDPNPEFQRGSPLAIHKRFRSMYYDENRDKGDFVEFSGFNEFPFYIPRWDLTDEDIYGTDCPAMTALGDVKQLQLQEKRKAQGIDKTVNPPLHGPPSLQHVTINSLPGGATVYRAEQNQKLEKYI